MGDAWCALLAASLSGGEWTSLARLNAPGNSISVTCIEALVAAYHSGGYGELEMNLAGSCSSAEDGSALNSPPACAAQWHPQDGGGWPTCLEGYSCCVESSAAEPACAPACAARLQLQHGSVADASCHQVVWWPPGLPAKFVCLSVVMTWAGCPA